ncbi:hypothetical protein EV426DRAFT_679526 [Tirmania nivea]|nr:hypothetical protein EV426DRAFT_679526 [Tirmania nivea]
MPARRSKAKGKAPAQLEGPRPSTITPQSTFASTSWAGAAASSESQAQLITNPAIPALPATASTGPRRTTCITEPDPALIESLSCHIRSFFTSLFTASPYTYAEHLRSLQLSLEPHLRNHYSSIKSDATWERIFGWCPNHNTESSIKKFQYLQRHSYSLPPAMSFQGSAATGFELPVTWLDLGVMPRTQKVHEREIPSAAPAWPPRRHREQFAPPPRPALHTRASTTANTCMTSSTNGFSPHVGSQLSRPGEASRYSSTVRGATASGHTSSASPVNVRTSIGSRRRHRPALRLDQSPSREFRTRMNSNRRFADDLDSESEFSISDDDDDGGDDDDDDVDIRNFVPRYRIRYQRVDVNNVDDAFPPLPTAATAAQPGCIIPRQDSPSAASSAAPTQSPQPNPLMTARQLAEEVSILLGNFSRSTCEDEQQNHETIRSALHNVHQIWGRVLRVCRAHGTTSYSAAVLGSTSVGGIRGGRITSESESDQTFRPYSACIICYNAVADTVLIPCHHLVLCMGCCNVMGIRDRPRTWSVLVQEGPQARVAAAIKCPLCRAVVSHRIKIYRG